nr:hypothetical protein CFP56_57558 [Quercus suber]
MDEHNLRSAPTELEQHYAHTRDTFTSPLQTLKAAHIQSNARSFQHAIPPPKEEPRICIGIASPSLPSSSYKSESVSSTGSSSVMTAMSSIDLEKSLAQTQQAPSTPRSDRRDPEKAEGDFVLHADRTRANPNTITYTYAEADGDEVLRMQETKALEIILFLSGPCVALSLLNATWTLISVVITLLTQPVRLCARRPSFGLQLAGLLGPALNLQLRSIYTPLPPHADEDTSYHTFQLMAVLLVSPLLSMGMMLVSWVVAVYWASSLVVGDPAGLDKGDDGRDTVLALRRWWESIAPTSLASITERDMMPNRTTEALMCYQEHSDQYSAGSMTVGLFCAASESKQLRLKGEKAAAVLDSPSKTGNQS